MTFQNNLENYTLLANFSNELCTRMSQQICAAFATTIMTVEAQHSVYIRPKLRGFRY